MYIGEYWISKTAERWSVLMVDVVSEMRKPWSGHSRFIETDKKEAVINSYFLDMPKQTITIFNSCLVYPSFLYDTSRLSCLPVDKPSVIT